MVKNLNKSTTANKSTTVTFSWEKIKVPQKTYSTVGYFGLEKLKVPVLLIDTSEYGKTVSVGRVFWISSGLLSNISYVPFWNDLKLLIFVAMNVMAVDFMKP